MSTKVKKGRAKASVRKPRTKRLKPRPGGPPFGPGFFAETLPQMVKSCPVREGAQVKVSLHLGDGTVLDVCQVVALTDRYCVVAAYDGVGEDGIPRTADDIGLEALPYDLVLRASVRAVAESAGRLGFTLAPPPPAPAEAATDARAPSSPRGRSR